MSSQVMNDSFMFKITFGSQTQKPYSHEKKDLPIYY